MIKQQKDTYGRRPRKDFNKCEEQYLYKNLAITKKDISGIPEPLFALRAAKKAIEEGKILDTKEDILEYLDVYKLSQTIGRSLDEPEDELSFLDREQKTEEFEDLTEDFFLDLDQSME